MASQVDTQFGAAEQAVKQDEAERLLLARRALGDKDWSQMSEEDRDTWKKTMFPGYTFELSDDEIGTVFEEGRAPINHEQVQQVQEQATIGNADVTAFIRAMHNVKEKPSAHGNLLVGKVDNFTLRCRLAVGRDAVVRNTVVEVSIVYDKSDEVYNKFSVGIAHDRDDISLLTLYDGTDRVADDVMEDEVLTTSDSTGDLNKDLNNDEIKDSSDESSLD